MQSNSETNPSGKDIHRGVEQLVARRAHNPEVVGSSPASATTKERQSEGCLSFFLFLCFTFLTFLFSINMLLLYTQILSGGNYLKTIRYEMLEWN